MRVLRVESHAHGEGPYQLDLGGSPSYGQSARPAPADDIRGWYDEKRSDYFFGFLSWTQLLAWWDEDEIHYMIDAGLQVSVYEVPAHKVVSGPCQCAFLMEVATYVRKEPTP